MVRHDGSSQITLVRENQRNALQILFCFLYMLSSLPCHVLIESWPCRKSGQCPCQIMHKVPVWLSVKTSEQDPTSSDSPRVLLIQAVIHLFPMKMGLGSPVGVRTVDPSLASSQSACNDFIQPHSEEQQGVTRVDVAMPALPLRNPMPV